MKEYTVTLGGLDHTLLLSDEEAKRYGDLAKATSGAHHTKTEGEEEDQSKASTKAKAPVANKAREAGSK